MAKRKSSTGRKSTSNKKCKKIKKKSPTQAKAFAAGMRAALPKSKRKNVTASGSHVVVCS